MAPSIPNIKLNDGTSIPAIGFGTGTTFFEKDCTDGVVMALKNGYRYIDTAQQYMNAKNVGEALRLWGGKREEVYIVVKFGVDGLPDEEIEPRKVLDEQLAMLGTDYVDMYLIHGASFAKPNVNESWKIMEQIRNEGKTKSIGISNFREEDISQMASTWKIPPAVNQIEHHPYVSHADYKIRTAEICKKYNITILGYGSLTPLFRSKDGPIDDIVEKIAGERGITVAQVLILWSYQTSGGGGVVTTSRDDGHQKEQLASPQLDPLSSAQIEAITEAGKRRYFSVWDPSTA